MAFSVSEQLQIVYSDNSSKYNIEKEAEEEQLSTIVLPWCFEIEICRNGILLFGAATNTRKSDNSSKYNIEKEGKNELLSTIELVNQ